MLADLAGFLEDVDVFFAERQVGMFGVVLVDELRQAERAGHSGRASADDDYVGFHLGAVDVFEGSAENEHQFQVSSFKFRADPSASSSLAFRPQRINQSV